MNSGFHSWKRHEKVQKVKFVEEVLARPHFSTAWRGIRQHLRSSFRYTHFQLPMFDAIMVPRLIAAVLVVILLSFSGSGHVDLELTIQAN